MGDLVILNEEQIEKLLRWDQVIPAVRQSLLAVSCTKLEDERKKDQFKALKMVNPKRIFMDLPSDKGTMLCMPGYVEGFDLTGTGNGIKENALSCKILNITKDNKANPQAPTLSGYIYLFDENTGKIQAMLGGENITAWRTAALSCIATNLLWSKANVRFIGEKRILAVLGAGVQGRIHTISFQELFHFDEIRIWNRTTSRSEKLVVELKRMIPNCDIKLCQTSEACARGADVIVTATSGKAKILEEAWVKPGAIINVVGVGPVSEIASELYEKADVYVESLEVTNSETPDLKVVGELGQLEQGLIKTTSNLEKIQIFASRGMGIHDGVMARLIYNNWMKNQPK